MFRLGFYLIISAFIFSSLISCGREERDLFPLSQTIKEWSSFKEGSYWIYQNDSTEILDSMFVGYNGKEIYPSADNTYDVETVNTTITNTDNILLGFIFAVGANQITFQDVGTKEEYSCAAGFNIKEDKVEEEKIAQGYYAWSVRPVDDQIIHDITYHDVIFIEVKWLDEEGTIIEGTLNRYWIAKNNWIIKKTFVQDGETYSWSLLRKNIFQ